MWIVAALADQLVTLAIGFALTSVVGGFLGYWFQGPHVGSSEPAHDRGGRPGSRHADLSRDQPADGQAALLAELRERIYALGVSMLKQIRDGQVGRDAPA